MTRKRLFCHIFLLTTLPLFLISQEDVNSFPDFKNSYLTGQFSMGYGYYLNGGDLLSPGFEVKAGKFLTRKLSLGGGLAYTQFKPLDGLYGISLLSELRCFVGEESKNLRFSGIIDIGVGMGGSRLQTGWKTYNPGPRIYTGVAIYKKLDTKMKLILELGYLHQYLSYKDSTQGRGWQFFQTESILKYNFRRIQLKTGIFF